MIMFWHGTETLAYDCLLTCGNGKNGLHLIYGTQRAHNMISKIKGTGKNVELHEKFDVWFSSSHATNLTKIKN